MFGNKCSGVSERRSAIQTPTAWINSPAEIEATWPTTGTRSAFAPRLHLQDGEAVVLMVEGHALNGSDERLSRWGSVMRRFQADNFLAEGEAALT